MTARETDVAARNAREETFWDEHVADAAAAFRTYMVGPDRNVLGMFEAVSLAQGSRVLDFACGAGVTSLQLADRGAEVTGIDVSAGSIGVAKELVGRSQKEVTFVVGDIENVPFEDASFDAIVGRYALHHVDIARVAPVFSRLLKEGGRAAFIETTSFNPLLRLARKLAGSGPIAKYSDDDEKPIDEHDLGVLRRHFHEVHLETADMSFLRLIDRNVLRGRIPAVQRLLVRMDQYLLAAGLGRWSYHQLVILHK